MLPTRDREIWVSCVKINKESAVLRWASMGMVFCDILVIIIMLAFIICATVVI